MKLGLSAHKLRTGKSKLIVRLFHLAIVLVSLIFFPCTGCSTAPIVLDLPASDTQELSVPTTPAARPPDTTSTPSLTSSGSELFHKPEATDHISGTKEPLKNPQTPKLNYKIQAQLDCQEYILRVDQKIKFTNQYNERLSDLVLIVEANRSPGTFKLIRLTSEQSEQIESISLDTASLSIELRSPLLPGEIINLNLSYEIKIPNEAGPLGYSERQINIGDWYPFVPPYRSDIGWIINEPGNFGEHLVYQTANYDVEITLHNANDDAVIAASALPLVLGSLHTYHLENGRSFSWSVSNEYIVLKRSVGPIHVQAYVFPEHIDAGEAVLEAASQAIAAYSKLIFPYPHLSFSIVEADFIDGMEYDGLCFLGSEYYKGFSGDAKGYLTIITVHEVSHQWWYGLVANNQALEPWLDEALATYSELLYYERHHPELINWWWNYRVDRFYPSGSVNSTIYDHATFRSYVNAVYLRGARFMHELRQNMGDELFLDFIRNYASSNINDFTDSSDFFSQIQVEDTQSFIMLVDEYFTEIRIRTE